MKNPKYDPKAFANHIHPGIGAVLRGDIRVIIDRIDYVNRLAECWTVDKNVEDNWERFEDLEVL